MKFSRTGALLYATYLGGPNTDEVTDLAIDAAGSVYVLGVGFPLSLQYPVRGQGTGVVAKISSTGALQWASSLGLEGTDRATRVSVDGSGSVYIAGHTERIAFPTTPGALRLSLAAAPLYTWNGAAWQTNAESAGFTAVAVDAGNPRVLWAFRGENGTLLRSLNSGANWTLVVNSNLTSQLAGQRIAGMAARGNTVLVVVGTTLLRSTDAGQNFTPVATEYAPKGVAFDSTRADTIYLATDTALLRSTNNGGSWAAVRGGAFLDVVAGEGILHAIGWDGSTARTLLTSRDGGTTWDSVPAPDGLAKLAIGPQNRLFGVAGTLRASADGGRTWTEVLDIPHGIPEAIAGGPAAVYAAYGRASDAFIMKLSASGATLEFSTLYGGSGVERATALAVDDLGHPVLAGVTRSADLPQEQAIQSARGGAEDGFVARFSRDGARLLFGTVVGGGANDAISSIARLAAEEFVYAGWTSEVVAEEPPLDRSEGWVRRLAFRGAPPATVATWARSRVQDVAADDAGAIWAAIETKGQGLATADAWQPGAPGGPSDLLLSRLSAARGVEWSTYYGGGDYDSIPSIAARGAGEVALTVWARVAPLSHPIASTGEVVLSRWSPDALRAPTLPENAVVNAGSYRPALQPGGAVAPGGIVAIFGEDLARGVAHASTIPLPTDLLGTTVTVNGMPAPLFYVSPQQVNAQIPFDARIGTALVQVRRAGVLSAERRLEIVPVSVGLWNLTINPVSGAVNPGAFSRGARLLLYATGLGALERPVATGAAATNANEAIASVTAKLEGIPLTVEYAGAAPGFVGLYQINVVLPSTPVEGTLVVTAGGFDSNGVHVKVQ